MSVYSEESGTTLAHRGFNFFCILICTYQCFETILGDYLVSLVSHVPKTLLTRFQSMSTVYHVKKSCDSTDERRNGSQEQRAKECGERER
jgi:hypothetical protein